MCGIAGRVGPRDPRLLRAMARILAHRGPDDEGFYEEGEVGLAARRLKIIDLVGGHQPLANEDESCWLVFNGEIYNFQDLGDRLESKGHRFRSKTDGETILHLYEEEGDDCLRHLEGMFAFALWDRPRRRLLLARDPLGIKPLYYRLDAGRLAFASELKALLLDPACPREVDLEALALYLTFLYIPSPATIFRGIRKLPPGHALVFEDGCATLKAYWDLSFSPSRLGDRRAAHAEVLAGLRESVKRHLISDVPLGVFLSSGMDSSTVVALMRGLGVGPIKTFTLDFEESSFSEAAGARVVAQAFGTEHHEFVVRPEVAELLPRLVWHLDEPLGDSSLIVTALVSELARREVTVALSGIGGDELFFGYPRYVGAKLARYYSMFPLALRRALGRLARRIPDSARSDNPPGRLRRFLEAGPLPEAERYLAWVSFLAPEALAELLAGHGPAVDPRTLHLAHFHRCPATEVSDALLYVDLKTYLPDDLLMLGDKMSMASSLELRVPFCDRRLVELLARLAPAVRAPGLQLKPLLREIMAPLLPPEVLRRPKRGFSVPLTQWFRGPLKTLALDLLGEERLRAGVLDPRAVGVLLRAHLEGPRSYFDQLFALVVFQLWQATYLDGWAARRRQVMAEVDRG
ncbi:MAG: asparagine synthase (glutamine-hydrolyzing) [Candidatus Rokubacteria bacterium]|nr:asparagine synthase (glutamine-hydrolyzing) [Candidatus Rokubacteria bacterium]